MKHVCLGALLTAVLCVTAAAQPMGHSAFGELVAKVPQLVRLQNQFEETPTGVTIEAKRVWRKGISGEDLDVAYYIYVRGVPEGKVFQQLQWPVDRDKPIGGMTGITLNSDGLMICAGRQPGQCRSAAQVDAPLTFDLRKPLKGEPRRFVFVAKELRVPISIVPDPVRAKDNGCRLNALRLSAKFEVALIEGSGFPPESEVRIHFGTFGAGAAAVTIDDAGHVSQSSAESVTMKTDARGRFQLPYLQNTDITPTGAQTVEAEAKDCRPKIEYTWGVL